MHRGYDGIDFLTVVLRSPSDGNVISFPISDVLTRQIRIEGSLMGGCQEMLQCLNWIRTGLVKPYVTEITFDDIPHYMQNFKALGNTGKIVARIGACLIYASAFTDCGRVFCSEYQNCCSRPGGRQTGKWGSFPCRKSYAMHQRNQDQAKRIRSRKSR